MGADRPAKHASLGLVGYAQGLPGRGSRGLYMEPMSGRDVGESLSLGYGLAELQFP